MDEQHNRILPALFLPEATIVLNPITIATLKMSHLGKNCNFFNLNLIFHNFFNLNLTFQMMVGIISKYEIK